MQTFLIIGFGKLGSALSRLLKERLSADVIVQGHSPFFDEAWRPFLNPEAYFLRLNREIVRKAQGIFITVPDQQIASVAEQLKSFDLNDRFVVHMSGLVSAEVLEPLGAQGALIGSLHPLQTFNERFLEPHVWDNITCTFQGDLRLLTLLHGLFSPLHIRLLPVTAAQKTAIHLAAVVAANYQVALYAWAQQILEESQLKSHDVARLLGPLVRTVAENFTTKPLPEILSGPIQRGDTQTIHQHLNLLERQKDGSSVQLYKLLGRKLLQNPHFPIANREQLLRIFNDR